jgi:hypothetical protein
MGFIKKGSDPRAMPELAKHILSHITAVLPMLRDAVGLNFSVRYI